mgnify:CR=1 FL=1
MYLTKLGLNSNRPSGLVKNRLFQKKFQNLINDYHCNSFFFKAIKLKITYQTEHDIAQGQMDFSKVVWWF